MSGVFRIDVVSRWKRACDNFAEACVRHGGEVRELSFKGPASDDEVLEVERALEVTLPTSLRRDLTELSAAFAFSWVLPDDAQPPEPFAGIFSGGMSWNIAALPKLDAARRHWMAQAFPNAADPYDQAWHDKIVIHDVGNGDYVAVDLEPTETGRVVYLSHDHGQGHGLGLGGDLRSTMNAWTQLGCAGPEDWQWLPFFEQGRGLIANSERAAAWRHWLGV